MIFFGLAGLVTAGSSKASTIVAHFDQVFNPEYIDRTVDNGANWYTTDTGEFQFTRTGGTFSGFQVSTFFAFCIEPREFVSTGSTYTYTWSPLEQGTTNIGGMGAAKANLLLEGAGHSAALHSNTEANIRSAGVALPVSRLVVNQASSFTAGGSLTNGFAPTTTLGCGSWGGNSISENLDYKHLMNVSRIGKVITNKKVPTDAEIWA